MEDGLPFSSDDAIAQRPPLRERIESELALARATAFGPALQPEVPGFEIVREIGRGGMGIVYLARQSRVGNRLVALKVLPASESTSERSRRRFREEINALAGLRHANVVQIYEAVPFSGGDAFAMEWIQGISLADVIRSTHGSADEMSLENVESIIGVPSDSTSRSSTLDFICRTGITIASALEAVHDAGFLHRDVKPSNILLRKDGTAYLADFGIAYSRTREEATRASGFAGTARYAAPEQLAGADSDLDARADVYSLGVSLREVLHGIHPPARPHEQPADGRIARLEKVLVRATAMRAADRYESAADLRTALEHVLSTYENTDGDSATGARPKVVEILSAPRGLAAAIIVVTFAIATVLFLAPRQPTATPSENILVYARHELAHPMEANLIEIPLYDMSPIPDTYTIDTYREESVSACEAALVHYDAIADSSLAIALERETVWMTLTLLRDQKSRGFLPTPDTPLAADIPALYEQHLPRVADAIRTISAASTSMSFEVDPNAAFDLDNCTLQERIHIGLFAYLWFAPYTWRACWLDLPYATYPLIDLSVSEYRSESGEVERARNQLEMAIESFPESWVLHARLARNDLIHAEKNVQGALDELEKARSLLPKGPTEIVDRYRRIETLEAMHQLVQAGEQGDADRRKHALETLRDIKKRRRMPHERYASLRYLREEDPDEALEDISKLVHWSPHRDDLRASLGEMVDAQWANTSPSERLLRIRRGLDEDPMDRRSLAWRVRATAFDDRLWKPILEGAQPTLAEWRARTKKNGREPTHSASNVAPERIESDWYRLVRTLEVEIMAGIWDCKRRQSNLAKWWYAFVWDSAARGVELPALLGRWVTALARGERWLTRPFAPMATVLVVLLTTPLASHGQVKSHQKVSDTDGGFAPPLPNQARFGTGLEPLTVDYFNDEKLNVAGSATGEDSFQGAFYILSLDSAGVTASQRVIPSPDDRSANERFGTAFCELGDLDADGTNELVVSSIFHRPSGGFNVGAIRIMSLNQNGSVAAPHILITQGPLLPLVDNDWFGASVACLGDLDGDGNVEIAIGSPGFGAGSSTGTVWILSLDTSLAIVGTPFRLTDPAGGFPSGLLMPNDQFGRDLAVLGDLDGDGTVEVAIGAAADSTAGNRRGAIWIVSLDSAGVVTDQHKITQGVGGFQGMLADDDLFGYKVANLGDRDADGRIEIGVSAVLADDGGPNRGAVWILSLNDDGSVWAHRKISDTSGGFAGSLDDNDQFGSDLTSFPDLDGDTIPEILIGANLDDDGGSDHGAFWMLFMDAGCIDGTVDLTSGTPSDALYVNGQPRRAAVSLAGDFWATMLPPPTRGNGRFVVHADTGFPTVTSMTPVGFEVGPACFPFLAVQGSAPIATWNGLGKENQLGMSRDFNNNPIANPGRAPDVFFWYPEGALSGLGVGVTITLQGILLDPGTKSSRGVSTTNAVYVTTVP